MERAIGRTVVGAHYGLRDWLAQRATAAVLALYTLALLLQLLQPGAVDQARWTAIHSSAWMRAFDFVSVVAVAWHAWVGMRDIWMDYVKPLGIRLVLMVLTIAWVVGCAGWATQVIWRL